MATWKEVAGYEELYLISDEGQVMALPKEISTRNPYGEIIRHTKAKLLKPSLRGRGNQKYPFVVLSKNGQPQIFSLHRLVAMTFLPNPDDLPEVNHKDENPLNCNVSNLEWCDHQYNIEYSKNKAVEQYFDGEKIAEYKSIKYASELTGISRTAINNALTGYSMTAGGYKWKYCDLERSDDLSH